MVNVKAVSDIETLFQNMTCRALPVMRFGELLALLRLLRGSRLLLDFLRFLFLPPFVRNIMLCR